jgi:glutathione S-transferase
MKLYEFALAPNPRRVRMFLAEKGVSIPTVQVNLRQGEQFSPDFCTVNPFSLVPVLELDDGTRIGESMAICRYIELTHPQPALMGRDPKEQAIIEMWNRRAELDGLMAAAEAVRNGSPMFADRSVGGVQGGFPQIPALVERGAKRMARFFENLDRELAQRPYLAGAQFTIADITAFAAIDFAKRAEITMPATCANVKRWYDSIASRPSAQA